jgi:hypothetical protein
MVSARAVRTVALVVCVAGIAGMIVTSILNHNGAAVTFGLITAVAVVCSMVAKAVAADAERRLAAATGAPGTSPAAPVEVLADLVEQQVQALAAAGSDEAALRQLVGEAVRLGRNLNPGRAEDAGGRTSFPSDRQL